MYTIILASIFGIFLDLTVGKSLLESTDRTTSAGPARDPNSLWGPPPKCFEPPSHADVSQDLALCRDQLTSWRNAFPNDNRRLWSGNLNERQNRSVMHLPLIRERYNHDTTKMCLMYLTDNTEEGDVYRPSYVVRQAQDIATFCMRYDKCGVVPMLPHNITQLVLCGDVQKAAEPRRAAFDQCVSTHGGYAADDLGLPAGNGTGEQQAQTAAEIDDLLSQDWAGVDPSSQQTEHGNLAASR